jgi:hypothetical protein
MIQIAELATGGTPLCFQIANLSKPNFCLLIFFPGEMNRALYLTWVVPLTSCPYSRTLLTPVSNFESIHEYQVANSQFLILCRLSGKNVFLNNSTPPAYSSIIFPGVP